MTRALVVSSHEFVSLSHGAAPRGWASLPNYAAALPLVSVPVADTELLNVSVQAPIAIVVGDFPDSTPIVSLLLEPQLLKRTPFMPDGRWMAPYTPISLRILPFALGSKNECLIAPVIAASGVGVRRDIESAPGKPSADFQPVLDLIKRLSFGVQRLSDAARILMASDVLVQVEPLASRPDLRIYFASAERLAALKPGRAAGLTAMGMLPLELAAASLFSRQMFKGRFSETYGGQAVADYVAPAGSVPHNLDPVLADSLSESFALDGSHLFSFEHFAETAAPEP